MPTDPETKQPTPPLVNENSNPNPRDTSELARITAHNKRLVKDGEDAKAREEALRGQITSLAQQKTTLEDRIKVLEASRTGGLPSGTEYTGPSQSEIYLALITGFTSKFNPFSELDDKKVLLLAKSVAGMSSVFHSEAAKHRAFTGQVHSETTSR